MDLARAPSDGPDLREARAPSDRLSPMDALLKLRELRKRLRGE